MGVDRSKLGKTNKRKGNEAERYYAKQFRDMGFEHCKTARQGSKLFDDCGIDLIFVPVNVQIKYGEQRGMKPAEELINMREKMALNFPPTSQEFNYPRIVIHKKPAAGARRIDEEELVTMTFVDFKKLFTQAHKK